MSELRKPDQGPVRPSTKPEGRWVPRKQYHEDQLALTRTMMRFLVALESDPVNLEAVMSELRGQEAKHGG